MGLLTKHHGVQVRLGFRRFGRGITTIACSRFPVVSDCPDSMCGPRGPPRSAGGQSRYAAVRAPPSEGAFYALVPDQFRIESGLTEQVDRMFARQIASQTLIAEPIRIDDPRRIRRRHSRQGTQVLHLFLGERSRRRMSAIQWHPRHHAPLFDKPIQKRDKAPGAKGVPARPVTGLTGTPTHRHRLDRRQPTVCFRRGYLAALNAVPSSCHLLSTSTPYSFALVVSR